MENYANNLDEAWYVNAGCESVRIQSELYQIEWGYDFLTISDISGEKRFTEGETINALLYGQFTVQFTSDSSVSDEGFILVWTCTNNK